MSNEILVISLVSFTIILIMLVLAEVVLGTNRKMKTRMKVMRQRMGVELPEISEKGSLLRDDGASSGFDKMVKKALPSTDVLNQRLKRAGLQMGPGGFVASCLVLSVIMAAVLKFVGGFSMLISFIGGGGFGLGSVHFFVGIMVARRKSAFSKAFPDAIDLIVRAVKSGLPVSEGISIVGSEMQGPVAKEFQEISEAMKIGETMDEALWSTAKRLENPEFNFFVISLVVQSETGGNLAETLDNLSDILRQRQTMKLKVRALASEARASAYILGGLPFIMVGILELLSPGYTQPLYQHDTGIAMAVGALISIGIGAAVMFKMVRFEV